MGFYVIIITSSKAHDMVSSFCESVRVMKVDDVDNETDFVPDAHSRGLDTFTMLFLLSSRIIGCTPH